MKRIIFALIVLLVILTMCVSCAPVPVQNTPSASGQVEVNTFYGANNNYLVRWIDKEQGYICYQTGSWSGGIWCGKLEQ